MKTNEQRMERDEQKTERDEQKTERDEQRHNPPEQVAERSISIILIRDGLNTSKN